MKRRLTDPACKNAKPGKNPKKGSDQGKDYKLADGGGLCLLVTTTGGKYWRYNYILAGRGKTKPLGTYPDVSLLEARARHEDARKQVKAGKDPVVEARVEAREAVLALENARPFRLVAAEWLAAKYPESRRAKSTINARKNSIAKLNAAFGELDISAVNKVKLLSDVLNACELAETYATRVNVQRDAIAIMGFAVGKGYIDLNPFAGVRFAASYTSPAETEESRPALVEPEEFGELLRTIDAKVVPNHDKRTRHAPINRLCLRILALTMVRPGELTKAQWSWIKWEVPKLVVPFSVLKQRTKRKLAKSKRANKDFEVPLSRQAVAELRELHKLTGHSHFLFPARPSRWGDLHQVTDKTLAEPTINAALNRIGYQGIHCAHGFRSSASTMLNAERVTIKAADGEEIEVLRWPDQKALIEVQLDHEDASTQAIYDRGGRWKERAQVMQLWADRIDRMRGVSAATRYPRPRLVA
jgi:integrase